MSSARAIIHEVGAGRWRCGVRLPNGDIAMRVVGGRLVDVEGAVDEVLAVVADEWPSVAHLDAAAIDWWIADVLDDLEADTEPAPAPTSCPRRPLTPLEQLMRPTGTTDAEVARRLGIDSTQLRRWRVSGVSDEQADRLATTLGLHPAIVWPDW